MSSPSTATTKSSSTTMALEALPVASAIGVFGVIYGATASTVMDPSMAVASSVLMFSGAAQFTMVGLWDTGATASAVVLAVAILGLRHLPLAAVVLPRVGPDRRQRALLSLVLIDETVGLAVASERPAARTLAVVGIASWVSWVVGTTAGVLGADLVAVAPVADVVFVILFVGLSSLTCRRASDVVRAGVSVIGTFVVLQVAPGVGALGAIAIAIGAALTVGRATAS